MLQNEYNEKDLADAEKFRAVIHKEALAKARRSMSNLTSVIDRNPVETYFRSVWDYPGQWYLYVSIPEGYDSRDALVDAIVKDTLDHYRKRK